MREYLDYLPEFYGDIQDIVAIGAVVDELYKLAYLDIEKTIADFFVVTASPERLAYWEKLLGLISGGKTIEERRSMIIAKLQGTGSKLDEAKIMEIVTTITEGTARVALGDGILIVTILPVDLSEDYRFNDVATILLPLIPAHIALELQRHYDTWQDRLDAHTSWQALWDQHPTWLSNKNYIQGVTR